MQSGVFHSRDGTAIYYEVRGEGRPLILCYGLLCKREHWVHQVPFLEGLGYRVVLFDYRGHQRSMLPKNDQNLTLEWCARDVQDLMNFLELEEVACLGHSMGVPILTHLALLEPKRVKANVFVCGSVNNPFQQMLFTSRLDPLFELSAQVNDWAPLAGPSYGKNLPASTPSPTLWPLNSALIPTSLALRTFKVISTGCEKPRPMSFTD